MYKFWFGATHIKHAFDRGRRDVSLMVGLAVFNSTQILSLIENIENKIE